MYRKSSTSPFACGYARVRQPRLFNFYLKVGVARGAIHAVLTRAPWQAQMIFADGALAVDVRLTVADAVTLAEQKLARAARHLQKPRVFLGALCPIFGKETEKVEKKQDKGGGVKGNVAEKEGDNQRDKEEEIDKSPKGIGAVTPEHKSGQSHAEGDSLALDTLLLHLYLVLTCQVQ